MTHDETSPRAIRLMTALLLVATFAAGTGAGAGIARWVGPDRHGPLPPRMFGPEHFEELGLSADQREQARQISEQHRPELEAILRETFPKVRAINEQMEQELRDKLTAEQRAKLDQIKARRPPPPPPGSQFAPGPPPGPFGMPPGPPPR
jgi:hypothetical protein